MHVELGCLYRHATRPQHATDGAGLLQQLAAIRIAKSRERAPGGDLAILHFLNDLPGCFADSQSHPDVGVLAASAIRQ
jgi:hypothetical protein